MSQFCGSRSGLRSRSGVTSAANADEAIASALVANNAMRIELLRFVMKSSRLRLATKFCRSESLHHAGFEVPARRMTESGVLARLRLRPTRRVVYPPLKGEGRTAEGSPGWGGGRAAKTPMPEFAARPSPPPGPLARADLPPPGGGDLVLSSPGLTGRSSNHRPGILDARSIPGSSPGRAMTLARSTSWKTA